MLTHERANGFSSPAVVPFLYNASVALSASNSLGLQAADAADA